VIRNRSVRYQYPRVLNTAVLPLIGCRGVLPVYAYAVGRFHPVYLLLSGVCIVIRSVGFPPGARINWYVVRCREIDPVTALTARAVCHSRFDRTVTAYRPRPTAPESIGSQHLRACIRRIRGSYCFYRLYHPAPSGILGVYHASTTHRLRSTADRRRRNTPAYCS